MSVAPRKSAATPAMSSQPPPSSDGPKMPPRHRPTLENLNKDSTELDLWAFEDDLELGEEMEKPAAHGVGEADIPAPRMPWTGKPAAPVQAPSDQPVPIPPQRDERVRINVRRGRIKNQPAGPVAGLPKSVLEMEDLELWGDAAKEVELDELPGETVTPPAVEIEAVAPAATVPEETPGEPLVSSPVPVQTEAAGILEVPAPPAEQASPSPAAAETPAPAVPLDLRPRLNLTKAERIGLIALAIVLLVLGVGGLMLTLGRLPTDTARESANDFPIRGGYVTVNAANSYWREPILDGAAPETVRRGTRLLPVLELDVAGGKGVLRVLFRNENREVVGDAVTRGVQGGGKLLIPATAGFEDIGMHAAYRTGQTRPWTIEALEAPSAEAEGRAFKRLFEIDISTDRR